MRDKCRCLYRFITCFILPAVKLCSGMSTDQYKVSKLNKPADESVQLLASNLEVSHTYLPTCWYVKGEK